MPLTSRSLASRADMALVLVDIQHRLAAVMPNRDRVVSSASRLARCAALVGAPIVVTRQYPKGLGGTVEDLETVLFELARGGASVMGVDKLAFCCAREHDFMDALVACGRRQVIIAGMETHICVTQTALALLGEYDVQVVADACCSRRELDHEVALDRIRASGAVVTTAESVMYEAVGEAGTSEFKRLLDIVKE